MLRTDHTSSLKQRTLKKLTFHSRFAAVVIVVVFITPAAVLVTVVFVVVFFLFLHFSGLTSLVLP